MFILIKSLNLCNFYKLYGINNQESYKFSVLLILRN